MLNSIYFAILLLPVEESGEKWKMFFGSYKYTIDDKGRLVLPKKFRSAFLDKIYLLRGFDGSVSLYTKEAFDAYLENLATFPYEKKLSRDVSRIALASIRELEIDSQSRVLLPKEILEKYGLSKDVMIVGLLNHIEVWDLEKWNEYEKKNEKDFEVNTEKFYDEH